MNKKWNIYILLIVAILFVTIFSYTTSPLYCNYGNTPDSPIFQIIGKYWAKGVIPYKDLWDLKGPYIFFVNAIGYKIVGTKIGVYSIQIISLFFTLLIIYKSFTLHFAFKNAFFFTLLSLAGLSYIYEGGNLTEEFILFPLSLSFYYIIKWINEYENKLNIYHPPLHSLIYGIVLGLSLMSRLTNALSLCAAVAVITFVLVIHKEYKNLIINVFAFVVGFAITTFPFILYFYYQDALNDMWNATFLFALKYAGNAQLNLSEIGIHYFLLSYLNSLFLIFIALFLFFNKKIITIRISLYFLSAVIPFLWFCHGNGFGHYGMIVYPLFVWIIVEIYSKKHKFIFILFSIVIIIGAFSKLRFMYVIYHFDNKEVAEYRHFLKNVSNINYNSFAAYNCDPNIYLAENICPDIPIFSLQEMGKSRIPEWTIFIQMKILKKQPEWLLVSRNIDNNLIIQPILDDNYKIVRIDSYNKLELYKRK